MSYLEALTRTTTGSRLYNDVEFFVSCDVNVPASTISSARYRPTAIIASEGDFLTLPGILEAIITGGDPAPGFEGNLTKRAGNIDVPSKRQGACGVWTSSTYKVGDGNPHQNFYLKQLSV